ncbi:MAG: UvrD-helicase domain-containing protein [Lautropia sp.]|nr:UvrD-helicase domain-containing protein [Lautropia sp.]
MSEPEAVEPLSFPLWGSRLIEASAGTGKTYTIAALYLRLVLGHHTERGQGGDAARGPLDPPEILVVTFTEAATLELRDRIRERLAEAADFFRSGALENLGHAADDACHATEPDRYLDELRASYAPESWPDCAVRLQLAAEWMDEAAVSTIHGWCSKMLREHAFDSGSLFSLKMVEDDEGLLIESIRDYWRSHVQQFNRMEAMLFSSYWGNFSNVCETLKNDLQKLVAVDFPEPCSPHDAMRSALDRLAQQKAKWQGNRLGQLRQVLLTAREKKSVNGNRLRQKTLLDRFDELERWAKDEDSCIPIDNKGTAWSFGDGNSSPFRWMRNWCTPEGARRNWKTYPEDGIRLFEEMDELLQAFEFVNELKYPVMLHAAHWVSKWHRQEREQRGELGFDDMLEKLDSALQSPSGNVLAARIRRQFPVAMIDEFQDTDPLQYRIFNRIYNISDNDPDTALILIGDPKQAIYAFRNADIYTYLRAREATAGRHYTLNRNFRSSSGMVEAVNRLFDRAEKRAHARGAFRFRKAAPDSGSAAASNVLPFYPVIAQGREDIWQDPRHQSGQTPALTIWRPAPDDPGNLDKSSYQNRFARATACEIAFLLGAEIEGSMGAGGVARMGDRGLRPADIAVLVNNGPQAALVRQALSRHGVASIYLSDRASVYASPVVADVERFLRACAEPAHGPTLRAALGSDLAGLSMNDLSRLQHDEEFWEAWLRRFQNYHRIWRGQGVLPAIRTLLQDFGMTERLLREGRERELTDLLHVSELLQTASKVLDGEHALIRFLVEQRHDPSGGSDERQQRLESDEARVRIVTVHKSKGLEYPLVFIPFFCSVKTVDPGSLLFSWHDEDGNLHHTLNREYNPGGSDEQSPGRDGEDFQSKADEDRLAEDLRKLYVALTRARYATWVGIDTVNQFESSAAAYLLGYDASHCMLDDEEKPSKKTKSDSASKKQEKDRKKQLQRQVLDDCLKQLILDAPAGQIAVTVPPECDDRGGCRSRATCSSRGVVWKTPPDLPARRWQKWWIASYSALETASTNISWASGPVISPAAADGDAMVSSDPVWSAESARADDWHEYMPLAIADVDDAEDDPGGYTLPVTAAPQPDGHSFHDFPRGPRPGTFLHGILEWIGVQGFATLAQAPELLRAEIARRLLHRPDWRVWQGVLNSSLSYLLTVPLRIRDEIDDSSSPDPVGGRGRRSADIVLSDLQQYQTEMSFMLSVEQLDVKLLDVWVHKNIYPGKPRPMLLADQLNGMLKGFIDLVFEWEGCYYVLDYKSNWLGSSVESYSYERMLDAVLGHRYDIQYLFYLLALHRLLRSRIPDYDYDRHVGGAVYIFLRGVVADKSGVFYARPPRKVIEALDAAFQGDVSVLMTSGVSAEQRQHDLSGNVE